MSSPTQRTLKHLRERGMVAGVVEKWIPQTKRRVDLLGFIDIVGCGVGPIVGVQSTSGSNGAKRVSKILTERADEARAWLASGGCIEVHAWRKLKKAKDRRWWHARIWDVVVVGGELKGVVRDG